VLLALQAVYLPRPENDKEYNPPLCRWRSAASLSAKCRFVIGKVPLRHWQSAASLSAKRRFVGGETPLCIYSGVLPENAKTLCLWAFQEIV
jgi:hypothetical protein